MKHKTQKKKREQGSGSERASGVGSKLHPLPSNLLWWWPMTLRDCCSRVSKKKAVHFAEDAATTTNIRESFCTFLERSTHHVFCFSIVLVPFQNTYIYILGFIHHHQKMGKGGNAATITTKALSSDNAALRAERQAKMKQEPKFYWASGDSMEEPHVLR